MLVNLWITPKSETATRLRGEKGVVVPGRARVPIIRDVCRFLGPRNVRLGGDAKRPSMGGPAGRPV